jgi:hypothetical protein
MGSIVWIAPGATSFSCLCEQCLEHRDPESFLDAIRLATVRGSVEPETLVSFARCPSGHALTIRRVDRPPNLARRNARQLQLA